MSIGSRLSELGLSLPEAVKPAFQYAAVVQSGDQAFVSGQLPKTGGDHGLLHYGKVDGEVSLEQGRECARLCVLHALSVLVHTLGEGALDRIEQVVQVTGFVAASPDFYGHPKVIDGASELLVEIFGERGRHARAAVGVSSLPRNAPVEIAFIFRLSQSSGVAS
ncbi:MAG: RidA family protein [Trueperaceae bacterium]